MSLTIPRAGVIAGATATPRIEPPQTGNIMADFGDRMADVAIRLQKERDDRSLGRARVEMMSGLSDLQTEFDQVGDPDLIDAEYMGRANALKAGILDSLSEGAREQAALDFEEMSIAPAARQGRRAIGLRQDAEMATVMAAGDELVRAASLGDPDMQATYRALFDQQLEGLVARGIMPPDEAQRVRSSLGGQMEDARATRMLSDNPDTLVQAIDAGEFSQMKGDALQGWRARAVAASSAAAARNAAEAKRQRSEQLGQAQQVLKDGIAVMRKGQPFAGAAEVGNMLADPEIAALPEAREYAATVMLTERRPELAVMPIAQKRQLLAELETTPLEKPYEADVTKALRDMIEQDEKQFREDPLGYAAEIGLKAPPALPEPSVTNPEQLISSLRARAVYAKSLIAGGYVDAGSTKFFTPDEREEWGKLVAPTQSPDVRARLAGDMAAALGPDAEAAAREIGADPLFTYVGGGLAHGLPARLGREIFEGERVIEGKQIQLPVVTARREAFFGNFSSLFFDGTTEGWDDQSGARDQIIAAADALYAYRMRGKVADGDGAGLFGKADSPGSKIQETAYMQAVHDVMGGTGSYNGKDARGGVQEIRDQMTILPDGVAAGDVESRLDALALAGSPAGATLWRAISTSGSVPDVGGELPGTTTIFNMQLRAIGNTDQYVMTWPNPDTGEATVVLDQTGGPFVISMKALLTKVAAR